MSIAPILNRTGFYDVSFGGIRFLDWNLVNTALGAMLEPRGLLTFVGQDKTNYDQENNELDELISIDENTFFRTFNGGGRQLSVDVNI